MSESDDTYDHNRRTTRAGMAGRRIGHYTLVRELGHGGQGMVYLARDEILGRDVALKILHNVQALNPKSRLRFVREAETASKLTHPGICAVHEFGEFEDIPFLAMQYVEGTSLSEKISTARNTQDVSCLSFVDFESDETEKPASPPQPVRGTKVPRTQRDVLKVVEMIEEVARALHVAHEENLVHRDIKPANIMLRADGRPVILDFGMARDEDSENATLTKTGDLLGTPAYMSPEQLTRRTLALDRRSDIYSLGVTLFECLTLERPFSAPSREKLYQSIMFDSVPNPAKINRAVPRDVRAIIEMAMEKSPDRRYQTAGDFADDLKRFREKHPIVARPVGRIKKHWRWVQRNKGWACALYGISIMALVLLFVFGYKSFQLNLSLKMTNALNKRFLDFATSSIALSRNNDEILRLIEKQHSSISSALAPTYRLFQKFQKKRIPQDSPELDLQLSEKQQGKAMALLFRLSAYEIDDGFASIDGEKKAAHFRTALQCAMLAERWELRRLNPKRSRTLVVQFALKLPAGHPDEDLLEKLIEVQTSHVRNFALAARSHVLGEFKNLDEKWTAFIDSGMNYGESLIVDWQTYAFAMRGISRVWDNKYELAKKDIIQLRKMTKNKKIIRMLEEAIDKYELFLEQKDD